MSCFLSEEMKQRHRRDKAIAQALRQQSQVQRTEIKLLLLGSMHFIIYVLIRYQHLARPAGPGECGKSTIVKQMKIIHGNGYSAAERATFVSLIHQNINDAMASLLRNMPILGVTLADPELQACLLT